MPQVIKTRILSTGLATPVDLQIDPDFIEIFIQGDATGSVWNSVANPGVVKRAWWSKGMAQGAALAVKNTDGAATDQSIFFTANGFYRYDGSVQTPEAPFPCTAVSQAAQAVVTAAGHPYVVGDRVVLSGCVEMPQLNSMVASIVATNPGVSFTISINTTNIAASFPVPGTNITARRLPAIPEFNPRDCLITGITNANPMVVTVTENHPYHVGSIVKFTVPVGFGMTELDGLRLEVTGTTATTLTFAGTDSTGFNVFHMPLPGAVPFTYAQIVPAGEDANTLIDSVANTAFRGIVLGSRICGVAGSLIHLVATKADQAN